jgi:hypothetical protein
MIKTTPEKAFAGDIFGDTAVWPTYKFLPEKR